MKAPLTGTASYSQTADTLKQKMRTTALYSRKRDKKKCEICPDPEIDLEMDSREAAFAMLGQLWSGTTVTIAGGVAAPVLSSPNEATVIYHSDANMAS